MRVSTEALADGLGAASARYRERACRALYVRLREDPSAAGVIAAVLEDADDEARRAACALLASAPSKSDAPALVRALRDHDGTVREYAARALALGRIATPAVAVALLAASSDGSARVRAAALAALAVIAPCEPVARAVGATLVSDRFSVADAALAALVGAPASTADSAASLLGARDPLERRAGLALVHATGAPVAGALLAAVVRVARTGNEAYVRRAAARALGRAPGQDGTVIDVLTQAIHDWDPTLRLVATIALGQISAASSLAYAHYEKCVGAVTDDDLADLASALRGAGPPSPPHGALLRRLAAARGYARLDLADAVMHPHRARSPVPGVWIGGAVLPVADARLDDAAERARPAERPAMGRRFLALMNHALPPVRACAATFAAHLHPDVETAIALQPLADGDPDPGVRVVACALLDGLRESG